ncbi:hypothetical protein IFM89_015775 [Coptis chinensis]|uniref:Transposase MuDR plant domain-containing protein n=1 Tax=Coptis chinensis TaxID=261450 RepID=A0A835H6A8_9MAGN|nr:hypothetical protein IFM89_015775 [Coptis chinensis]
MVAIVEPIVKLLRMVDGDECTLGYIYEGVIRVKESIKMILNNDKDKYDLYLTIIERKQIQRPHSPVHAKLKYLNPKFYYEKVVKMDNEIRDGMSKVRQKLLTSEERKTLTEDISFYHARHSKIFNPMAVDALSNIHPHEVIAFPDDPTPIVGNDVENIVDGGDISDEEEDVDVEDGGNEAHVEADANNGNADDEEFHHLMNEFELPPAVEKTVRARNQETTGPLVSPREFVIHYDGFWIQIVPGRMRYLDYHGGYQFHLMLDGDELSYMGLIEDIHKSVGDDVPINGVNCICRGFLTTIYNNVGVMKMSDTIKAERDQKFHLFVTMVTPDMMQPTEVPKPKLHSKPNAKQYKKPSIVCVSKSKSPRTPTKHPILNFDIRRSPRFSSPSVIQPSPINQASLPPTESKSKLVSTQSPSTPTKHSILNFEVRRSPRFSSPINQASPPPTESKSKLVSTQSPSTPTKHSILNFEVRRSPRFSSPINQTSPINQASPNEPIPISPTTDNTNQGEDGYEEIKKTTEDVVNEFAELFETGEAFVDVIQSDVSEDVVQNDESEDEGAPGRYFQKFEAGGPCVDMRARYESTHLSDNEDEDYTPKEDDEHADDLVNEAIDLEEEADDVINSLGNCTNNLYQEQYHSVEDEDVKQELVLKLEPGMQWKSMEECRKFLKTLAIQNLFSFRQKQNDKKRYRIYCIGEDHSDQEMVKGCTWKVACSLTTDNHTVKLRKYVGTHTCKADGKNHVVQAKALWVAIVLEDFLRDHPNMKHVDVHKEVFRRYGVELSYYTSWKSKGSVVNCYKHAETDEFVGFLLAYKASLDGYCSSFYNVQSFKATYAGYIYPFDNEEEWDKVKVGNEVLPPPFERKSGRPRKLRIRDADEDKPSNNRCCKICNVPGHNKRTCERRQQGGTKSLSKAQKRQKRGEGQEQNEPNVDHIPKARRGSRGMRGGRGSRGRGGRGMAYWFGEDTPPRSSQATPPPPASSTQ